MVPTTERPVPPVEQHVHGSVVGAALYPNLWELIHSQSGTQYFGIILLEVRIFFSWHINDKSLNDKL
jgi:hypothetical protein